MKQFLILAGAVSLVASAAQAQFQPIKPIGTIGSMQPLGSPKTPHVDTFKPYTPPKLPSVYGDGPFSPRGEAERQRKLNKPPAGGPFSPEGEARRRKAQEGAFRPF